MAVITGILKGPMGDVQEGSVIELRAIRTSATVITQERSRSVTDVNGRYSLSVEVGDYDVFITAPGRQPENRGRISVKVNSQTGSLPDFLTTPGESDLNPQIVETVDTMRAAAAASAASAKTSADNAAATLANSVKRGEFGIGGTAKAVTTENTLAAIAKLETGKYTVNAGANDMPVSVVQYELDWNCVTTSSGGSGVLTATAIITAPSSYDRAYRNTCRNGVWQGWRLMWDDNTLSNALRVGDYGLGADFRPALTGYTLASDYRINGAFYGNLSSMTDTFGNTNNHILNISGYIARTHFFQLAFPLGADRMGFRRIQNNGVGAWMEVWHTGNTTVDANGFLKKASPIVKLFGSGDCELNSESQGVTTERIGEGVYRVSGVLGFNSDDAWGGAGNGIEIPVDDNKRALVWVESKVLPDGDIEIRTYHRTYDTGPYSARNIEAMDSGEVYKKSPVFVPMPDGTPKDIPAGRWIDLRVEMPASDEPEPVPEEEVTPEPEDTPEPEQPEVTEPESGEAEEGDKE